MAALLTLLVVAPASLAGPPEPPVDDAATGAPSASDSTGTDTSSPSEADPLEVAEAPTILDEVGGFWLGVELLGPRGAQVKAAASLADGDVSPGLPRGGHPPPGELVGRVDTLEQALAWVARHAFDRGAVGFPGAQAMAEGEVAIPGGTLLRDHQVVLTALVVTAGSETGGTRELAWPSAALLPTPANADWRPAMLAVGRAPLFAAPSAKLPPASERYLEVEATHDLWQIGLLDRCEASASGEACLRWAQVLVRVGDRFKAGWLPSYQVVPLAAWVRDHGSGRFALLESHREPGEVVFVLLEQRDGSSPVRATQLRVDHVGRDWPAASLALLPESLTVVIGEQPVLVRALTRPAPLAPTPAPAPTP